MPVRAGAGQSQSCGHRAGCKQPAPNELECGQRTLAAEFPELQIQEGARAEMKEQAQAQASGTLGTQARWSGSPWVDVGRGRSNRQRQSSPSPEPYPHPSPAQGCQGAPGGCQLLLEPWDSPKAAGCPYLPPWVLSGQSHWVLAPRAGSWQGPRGCAKHLPRRRGCVQGGLEGTESSRAVTLLDGSARGDAGPQCHPPAPG